jgi:hypothetical protein
VGDVAVVRALSAMLLQILQADQSSEFATPIAPLTGASDGETGRILLGRQWLKNRTSPSRVVMIPISSAFGPANTSSNAFIDPATGQTQGAIVRKLRRPLATDRATYEVHVWAQALPADQENDIDATRYLTHRVIQAAQNIAMTSVRFDGPGEWGPTALVQAGLEFTFHLSIDMPVIDSSVQFPPAPLTVVPSIAISQGP